MLNNSSFPIPALVFSLACIIIYEICPINFVSFHLHPLKGEFHMSLLIPDAQKWRWVHAGPENT